MAETERRRRRPAVSCSLCRRRKIRCNREAPCGSCVQTGNQNSCIYEKHSPPRRRQLVGKDEAVQSRQAQGSQTQIAVDQVSSISNDSAAQSHSSILQGAGSTRLSTSGSQTPAPDVEAIKTQIRQLEEQLSNATLGSAQTPASTFKSRVGGTFHIHYESPISGQSHAISRSVTHKRRLFGQSHWINGVSLLPDICEIIEPYFRDETSKASSGIGRCKSLARVIKSNREPPWPTPLTPDLPSKYVADELVDCYLRTIETVYRILHVPTFKVEYEALWDPGTEPNPAFLVQLKLVLAIGTATHDDQSSLHASAIRWVYEARAWLSGPKFKSRLGIQCLQSNILLLLAQEIVGAGGDSIWVSAGALLRRAMYMGLHRDPAYLPQRTTFAAEMHRRLWNTILEVALQSSLTSGGPPLFSLDDFDTLPPGNFDEDELIASEAVSKPENALTQVSIAITLRKTLPHRLAVAKHLNNLDSHGAYEETLRLDGELRSSYKMLCRTLQGCQSSTGGALSQFGQCAVDFLVQRYLSALHIPFFGLALHGTTYAFSRKVVVENSLKIWHAVYPSSSIMTTQSRGGTPEPTKNDFSRLATSGAGFYRISGIQAAMLIAVELRTQLQEEEGLGQVPLRQDQLSVIEDGKNWQLQCIRLGETNIKGYLLMCVISAQIEGLTRRLGQDDIAQLLGKAVEDAGETCSLILEEMAGRAPGQGSVGRTQMPLGAVPDLMEDWDFMMSDALFNPSLEPMNWIFNDWDAGVA